MRLKVVAEHWIDLRTLLGEIRPLVAFGHAGRGPVLTREPACPFLLHTNTSGSRMVVGDIAFEKGNISDLGMQLYLLHLFKY